MQGGGDFAAQTVFYTTWKERQLSPIGSLDSRSLASIRGCISLGEDLGMPREELNTGAWRASEWRLA